MTSQLGPDPEEDEDIEEENGEENIRIRGPLVYRVVP